MSNIEDIYANQLQIGSAIETILTNFKKDGAERKTPDYLQRRLDILDNYWHEFINNHGKLSEFGIQSHAYFMNNDYDRVRERYEAIRSQIQTYQPMAVERPRTPLLKPPIFVGMASEPKPSPSTRGTTSKTEEMLRKQQSNLKAFQRTITNIDLDSVSEKWEFDDLLRTIQMRWGVVDTMHWELDSELDGSHKEYESVFTQYEKEYQNIKKAINKKMSSMAHIERSTPQMEIPQFHGNYINWISFKDLFTETIHNNHSMSKAQKMQYLKSKVKGEAERLIQHLNVSSDNYEACWEILNQRFNNKKLIFSSHINILLNVPVMQQQSINHIKRIHDTTLECLNAVKNLGVDIGTWDPLLVHILSQKLDTESHMDYVASLKQPRELPNLKEFLSFLETKFTTLESSRRKQDFVSTPKHQAITKQPSNYNYQYQEKHNIQRNTFSLNANVTPRPASNKNIAVATKYKCQLCKVNHHGIYYCQKFLEMSPHQRHNMVSKFKLCPNCLNSHQNECLSEWKSNLPDLLDQNQDQEKQTDFDFKQAESTKTLGLGWNPAQDCFTFQSKIDPSPNKCTKRILLSEISKLFDPLGWLSPLTTKLKIIFQTTWKANIGWDEAVPEEIAKKWNKIKSDIGTIEEYKIPRWLKTEEKDHIELHGFCDASKVAYACVVYCRKQSSVTMIAGKTKLVPLNKDTPLPRLELSGTLLLSKLLQKIRLCLSNYDIQVYGWCDSMAVLGWLHGDTEKWKPFVANRVKQIKESMPNVCWNYVKSSENPADCASRGLTAPQLKEHTLWWNGPHWLPTYQPKKEENQEKIFLEQELELRKSNLVNSAQFEYNIIKSLLTKHSSLIRIIRVVSWIRRFIHRNTKSKYLSCKELREARLVIIKQIQADEFCEEISQLKQNKCISKTSKLSTLNPIIDENGLLRLAGRLHHASIDVDRKHPIIIPNNTRLAELLIAEAHEITFHGGPRLTTAFMRQKYWLIGGIRAIKKQLRQCVLCRKHNPDQQYQLMGDLPSCRTNESRPFYHLGADYTGHVLVKANKGRGIKTTKGYVAVFVCMATKAVHLELVSDLSSSAFLAALRRMAARRGVPGHIYSDQGTNFIGANNILQQEYEHQQATFSGDFLSEVANMGIEWHFNAPAWPSAGGLWEAAVKSLKHHLRRVIGEQKLTFEEYSTLLAQLEGCLNSRPLCPVTEDPQDLDVLTPSHFLASGPALNICETETDLRTRWTLTQNILRDLWDRWRNEYLTLLAARSKWRKPQRNVKINDIVTIRDENLPPGKWALGRVISLHPGGDGYVRVVTLKTKSGIIKRPIVKISVLPVVGENQAPEPNGSTPPFPLEKEQGTKLCHSTIITSKPRQYSLSQLAMALLLFL